MGFGKKLKKIGKSVGKAVKKVASNPIVKVAGTAAAGVFGGPAGAALAGGVFGAADGGGLQGGLMGATVVHREQPIIGARHQHVPAIDLGGQFVLCRKIGLGDQIMPAFGHAWAAPSCAAFQSRLIFLARLHLWTSVGPS